VWVEFPGSRGPYPLRLPRLLPLVPGPPPATAFRLRVNDTCGLFTLFHTIAQPAGAGPPPHLHYGEDEYFIVRGRLSSDGIQQVGSPAAGCSSWAARQALQAAWAMVRLTLALTLPPPVCCHATPPPPKSKTHTTVRRHG
jgi:hypothetical protein